MIINREKLIGILERAAVGLTKREVLEQSSAYVFTGKSLVTFNGHVLTKCKSPLPEFTGAVDATDLGKILERFPDEEVDVTEKEESMLVKAGRRRASLSRLATIALPYGDVPNPGEDWTQAPDWLGGALLQAARACGADESKPRTTEVHVTKDKIEATDTFRIFQYTRKTRFKKEVLIPADAIEAVSALSIEEFQIGEGWLHLRTPEKHRLSLLLSEADAYPDVSRFLSADGVEKVSLPNTLGEVISRASVMLDGGLESKLHVHIEKGELVLTARKDSGWFKESKKVKYKGPTLDFSVHPKFLEEILSKTSQVTIGKSRMRIEAGEAVFVVFLEHAKKKESE